MRRRFHHWRFSPGFRNSHATPFAPPSDPVRTRSTPAVACSPLQKRQWTLTNAQKTPRNAHHYNATPLPPGDGSAKLFGGSAPRRKYKNGPAGRMAAGVMALHGAACSGDHGGGGGGCIALRQPAAVARTCRSRAASPARTRTPRMRRAPPGSLRAGWPGMPRHQRDAVCCAQMLCTAVLQGCCGGRRLVWHAAAPKR